MFESFRHPSIKSLVVETLKRHLMQPGYFARLKKPGCVSEEDPGSTSTPEPCTCGVRGRRSLVSYKLSWLSITKNKIVTSVNTLAR